ncbi:MAG: hypothetical protein IKR73_02885, partial [Oscillospiraceae bacterium]|nr:hypothetical protein [Oscillospiraceae bacterium]
MSFSGMILFGAAMMAGMLLKDTAVAVAVQKIMMDRRYDTIDMSALSERITNELNAVEMRRLRRMSGTIGEAVLKAESVDLRMSESRAEFERERMAEYDAAADRLRAELNATGDLTAFMKSCEEMSERICLRLDKAREEIDTRCREELTRTMDTALTQIRSRRAEVQRSLDEIADAEERRARCADMVREMVETCERQTAEMAERFEGTKAQSAVSAVSELLRKARTELDAGLYEAALISVFAADDALCLRVQDMITDEVMLKSLYIRAASETERVEKVYDALREGDLVTDRTASGEHIERHIEDMAYYYRGAYETIGEELKRLRQALETPYT